MGKYRCLLSILMAILHQGTAIVGGGRDLVLTPKQSLQLNGKRIYYGAEQQLGHGQDLKQEQTERPWERTLKHVTYITLFTDAAVGAAAGNLSQLHDYHDFLQIPYTMPQEIATASASSRFGDIVTLASGRLEQLTANGSYRFVEGNAAPDRNVETRAVWRVQRIRHRDATQDQRFHGQRYHYELKFSVTPSIGYPSQSFIQRESDYPQSFASHSYREQQRQEQAFQAARRQDRSPQATFVHGIYQAPPNLNIGEYVKVNANGNGHGNPGLHHHGQRPNYMPATTYRPSYPTMLKFAPRPDHLPNRLEPYPLPQDVAIAAGDVPGGASLEAGPASPVTHHFHHHFYMAPGGNHAKDHSIYRPLSTEAPSHHPAHLRYQQQQLEQHRNLQFPSNREPSDESGESLQPGELDDIHQQHQQEEHQTFKGGYVEHLAKYHHNSKLSPLLIYAVAPVTEQNDREEQGQETPKGFVQSEPLEETVYRYSEPDPLYVHQHPVDVLQLEEEEQENSETQSAGSQKRSKLATPTTTAPPTVDSTTTTTTLEPPTTTTLEPPTTTTTTTTTKPTMSTSSSFVATSTNLTPLRALSRYRTTPRTTTTTTTTTTTELPSISKWRQRRKESVNNSSSILDSKPKGSQLHESKVSFKPTPMKMKTSKLTTTTPSTTTTTTQPSTTTAIMPTSNSSLGEVIEILTQKSVSKSVSIKVGANGEEIPIIVDDDTDDDIENGKNEVKRS